jgi:lactate permease
MTTSLPIILSVLPFLVFLFLLLVKKTSLLKTSLITLGLYTVLAIFYWQILGTFLYASFGKGIFVAIDIFLIIFGAILFLEVLKDKKIIQNISHYLSGISSDYRIQVILIAWFFECFIEGTAGFGTPAAIAVPLLIGLGLPPIRALIVGLLGNSIPGIFGAAGTPIRVGFSNLGVANIPQYAALLNTVGMIVPVFMLWIITAGRANRKKEFFEALPFALWSGILFVGFSILSLKLFGPEFPSILGSLFGIIVAIATVKLGIFVPKNKLTLNNNQEDIKTMSAFKSFLPYIILVASLILGKIIIGKIGFPIGIGFKHTFSLFNPGLIFMLVAVIVGVFWQTKKEIIIRSIKSAFRGAIIPFLVIASMMAMVEVMKNTGNNLTGLPSAINIIAKAIESNLLPFFAPFAGAFGALLTGSVTASNVMFGSLFNTTALSVGFNQSIILALLVVGAGVGNMVALADILTAEAVIGEKNVERKILRGVLVPCLTCLLIVGIVGMIIF